MTLNKKEEYELRIKNMQSKIDYLREQRENLTTYAKKYEPLTDEQKKKIEMEWNGSVLQLINTVEALHGIK